MDKTIHPTTQYPPAWRDICRRVVEEYVEIQEEQTGQNFGSTKIARAMREPHRIPGQDSANARLEKMLTRQDIEAWLKRGVEFSDLKFRFVDCYVQSLLKSEVGEKLRRHLEAFRINRATEGLMALFSQNQTQEKKSGDIKDEMKGIWSFANPNVVNEFSQSIHFFQKMNGVHCSRMIVYPTQARASGEIIDNGKVFEGYLLPLSQGAEGEGLIGYTGVFLIRDPSSLNFFSEGKRRRLLGAMAHETMGMCTITVTATLMVLSISLPSVLREIVDPLDQVAVGSHSLTLIPSSDQAIAEAFEKLSGGIL